AALSRGVALRLGDDRRRLLARRGARRNGHRRHRSCFPSWRLGGRLDAHGPLKLGRRLEEDDGHHADEDDRRGLHRELLPPREEESAQDATMPGHAAGCPEDAVHESDRRAWVLDGVEEGDRRAEALPLAPAFGTARQVSVERGALGRGQRVVGARREELACVVTAHGRKRSSFALRSSRARCRRERTVLTGRSRTWAISSASLRLRSILRATPKTRCW